MIMLPYFSGCEAAVENTREVFEKTSKKNDRQHRIETVSFDITPISHKELLGYIVLTSKGDWRTLNSKTPTEYLQLIANGIVADCMPDNRFDIAWKDLGALKAILEGIPRNGKAHPKISEDGLRFYYNDGSYSFPDFK
jgi:hypothetical protein